MFSITPFITLSGFSGKVRTFLVTHFSLNNFFSPLALFASLLLTPTLILAQEKQLVNSTPKNATPKTTEGLLASTEEMIEQLIRQIDRQKEDTIETNELAENPNPTSFFSSIPNVKPVEGSITSSFGVRVHPIYHLPLFHAGIDFAVPEGTKVHSTGDGIVVFSGYDKGYGQKVTINHGYGYKTVYAHLSKSLVRQGQKINRGEIIAFSGNTGVSTGPHVHYEVHKNNVIVNPTAYFFDGTPDKLITIKKTSPEEEGNNS